jgi:RNA polymerase sigma factor (TIGR02999 family)
VAAKKTRSAVVSDGRPVRPRKIATRRADYSTQIEFLDPTPSQKRPRVRDVGPIIGPNCREIEVSLDPTVDVSRMLRAWGRGDLRAREELVPLVYQELRRRAAAYLRRERADHTLQPTALVHEAYLRLVGQQRVVWQNRAHFFGIAAQMMRRILVDHARDHQAAKRPGAALRVVLDDRIGAIQPRDCELLLIDQALTELARLDPRQVQIVELRYFGGLSEQEVAVALSVSRATVTREWQTARAWLFRRLTTGRSVTGANTSPRVRKS